MPLRLAIPDMVSPSYFPAIAAVELGFFAREGLDATVELIFPVTKTYEELREGRVDFVGGAAHAALYAFPEWRGCKLLCALSQYAYWCLAVRADLDGGRHGGRVSQESAVVLHIDHERVDLGGVGEAEEVVEALGSEYPAIEVDAMNDRGRLSGRRGWCADRAQGGRRELGQVVGPSARMIRVAGGLRPLGRERACARHEQNHRCYEPAHRVPPRALNNNGNVAND